MSVTGTVAAANSCWNSSVIEEQAANCNQLNRCGFKNPDKLTVTKQTESIWLMAKHTVYAAAVYYMRSIVHAGR